MKHFPVSPLSLEIQQPHAARINLCEPLIKGYHKEFVGVNPWMQLIKKLAIAFRRLFQALDSTFNSYVPNADNES